MPECTCHTCYMPFEPNDTECECPECARWRDYWASLTPAERKSEIEAMTQYTNEADY